MVHAAESGNTIIYYSTYMFFTTLIRKIICKKNVFLVLSEVKSKILNMESKL